MPPNTPEEMPTPPPPLDGERRFDEVTRNGRADEQAPQQFAAHSVRVHAHPPRAAVSRTGRPRDESQLAHQIPQHQKEKQQ
jgi:hypothetical protein